MATNYWVRVGDWIKSAHFKCSKCGTIAQTSKFLRECDFAYCPYCGDKKTKTISESEEQTEK